MSDDHVMGASGARICIRCGKTEEYIRDGADSGCLDDDQLAIYEAGYVAGQKSAAQRLRALATEFDPDVPSSPRDGEPCPRCGRPTFVVHGTSGAYGCDCSPESVWLGL